MNETVAENARAKINLTLRVLRRRADGYHDLASLVAFSDLADRVSLVPDTNLSLDITGPNAADCGPSTGNLVLKAALALQAQVPGLRIGRFTLDKYIPVAAGLGGGSADAAAALRALARVNGMAADDPRLFAAAVVTGADVAVCLQSRPRIMRGVGDRLGPVLDLTPLAAVLINPGVALSTKDVFGAMRVGERDDDAPAALPQDREALFDCLGAGANDMEPAALSLRPVIGDVLDVLRGLAGCRLARMSGSGATCFGLFDSPEAAAAGAGAIQRQQPSWWAHAGVLG